MSATRVTILHGAVDAGAADDEQDVLVQIATVSAALERSGCQVNCLPLSLNLDAARQQLSQQVPDLIFNLVESISGQGIYISLAPALLDGLELRYTGSPLSAIFLSSNKLLAKQLLRQCAIATPDWYAEGVIDEIELQNSPWLVKSVWEHASIGLHDDSFVYSQSERLNKLSERRRQYGGEWFAERYIGGREFNIALLAAEQGFEVLAPAEMLFQDYPDDKPRIVNYAAKWDAGSFEYHHTVRSFEFARHDRLLLETLKNLALRCAEVFQLRGYARVDFRVDNDNQPWVLDINSNPCLSPDAGFSAAVAASGLNIDDAIERIINDSLR